MAGIAAGTNSLTLYETVAFGGTYASVFATYSVVFGKVGCELLRIVCVLAYNFLRLSARARFSQQTKICLFHFVSREFASLSIAYRTFSS